jgi:hypothetical protein
MNAQWENSGKTIIRFTLDRGWSWNELHGVLDRAEHYAELTAGRVDAIVDVDGVDSARPAEMLSLSAMELARQFARRSGNLSYAVVIVGAGAAFKAMFHTQQIACRNGQANVQFANTVEQARAQLENDQLRDIVWRACSPA